MKGDLRWFVARHQSRAPVQWVEEDRGYRTPCWIWQLKALNGYGRTGRGGKHRVAHRAVYERIRGPVPEGLSLDHLCRERSCVNPDHLEAVTHAENCQRGTNTKLTADQVREIRQMQELSEPEVARLYGVARNTIGRIWRGETWKAIA